VMWRWKVQDRHLDIRDMHNLSPWPNDNLQGFYGHLGMHLYRLGGSRRPVRKLCGRQISKQPYVRCVHGLRCRQILAGCRRTDRHVCILWCRNIRSRQQVYLSAVSSRPPQIQRWARGVLGGPTVSGCCAAVRCGWRHRSL